MAYKKAYLLRRKKLGLTSCREICVNSEKDIFFVRNDKELPVEPDLCIRWGCTTNVPQEEVLNKAKAIHLVSDKKRFRKECMDVHPFLIPKTWFDDQEKEITYPCIIRPRVHHQGRNLYMVKNYKDMRECFHDETGCDGYISEFIDKVEEYRVFLIQGRVVCVAKKTPENPKAIAWNVAKGGRFDNVKWDHWNWAVLHAAAIAFNLSGLDFGGVDVMVDKNNKAWVLEVNSAPSLTSPYRQQCFAKAFDYIMENGKEHLPLDGMLEGWRHWVHPAIWSRK